jgi:outer membrane protein assembly factor BamB
MRLAAALLATSIGLSLAGCSTLESINPFASKGPKMAELSPIKTSVETRIVWREKVGKGDVYAFTPAIVAGSVYAAGKDGNLIRVDDGKLAWKINAGQPLSGGVGASGELVMVGTPKGELLAFASADGKLLWKAKATSEIVSPPVVGDGYVVARSGDNRLAAYDARDGKRKWIYQRPTPALSLRVTTAPIVDDQFIFAGFPGGKLIAVNSITGAAAWEGTVALPKGTTELDRVADITSPPVISGRMICAVAFQGRVACFELANGSLAWARDMSSAVGLSVDTRYLYVSDDKGSVHALDLASGTSIWKQDKLANRRITAPLALRGLVAVADIQGVVHFLSRDDGSFVARVTTDGSPVVAPLQVLSGKLLVQTSNGGVFAIEAN